MKKIIFFVIINILSCLQLYSQSTITWDGGGGNALFTNGTNWSTNVVPAGGDIVVFDGTGNSLNQNCVIDVITGYDIDEMQITSGYNGIITSTAPDLLITGDFSQGGGTFNCGAMALTILGAINQTGGTFISSSNINGLTVTGDFNKTGGTFTHNSGIVSFSVSASIPLSISGTIVFNRLRFYSTLSGSALRTVNFGSSITDSLILHGVGRVYAYQGSIDVNKGLKIFGTSSTNPTNNNGTINFVGAGPIDISSSSTAAQNKLPNLVFNTTGNISMSGNINVQGNWTGTQGVLTAGTSNVNFYGTPNVISGTAAAFHNLSIENGASVAFPATEVKIAGDLIKVGTGAFTFQSTSAIGLNGTAAQGINLSGATLNAINCYGPSTRAVTLSGAINVTDSIYAETNVTLNTGGNLTLKATSALKGRVGRIGGTISGNVTVETFIPAGTAGWANLGVNGVSGQTIANWDGQVPMTCDGCTFGPGSIPGGNFYSITGWNEIKDDYDTTVTSATALTPGKGFWVFVGTNLLTATDYVLSNNGSVIQGAGTIPITVTGTNIASSNFACNLIANPYASPISWSKLRAIGTNNTLVGGTIYVYNADLNVTTSYVAGAASPGGGGAIWDDIPAGQAFYVDGLIAGSLAYNESIKTDENTSSTPLLRTSENNDFGKIFRLKLRGALDWDATVFRIHSDATPNFDKDWDAHKIFQSPGYVGYPGSYSKYTTISSKDNGKLDYSIQSIPSLVNSVNIPLLVMVSSSGTYTIEALEGENVNDCVMLKDKLTNTTTDLKLSNYVFTISDTTSTPRFELILCKDESLNAVGISESKNESKSIFITQDAQGAFVKTVFEKNTKATISVYNVIGQKLLNDISVEGTVTTTQLPIDLHNQVVLIKVTTDEESVTKKVVLH